MAAPISIPWTQVLFYCNPISITGFAYGWEVGSMGGILAMPQFLGYFGTPSAFMQGLMTVCLIAGEIVGSLLVGLFVSDRLGRRKTIMVTIILYTVGQAILVAAQNRAMFIAGRVLNGVGAGPLFQTMSYYTAEIAPAHIRGRVTATMNLGIAIGVLVAYWVQYGALNISGTASWRLCFALQLVPGFVIAYFTMARPESPRWLLQHGFEDKATHVLAQLHGNGDVNNPVVQAEVEEIKAVVGLESSPAAPSYLKLLFGRDYRRRTLLAMGIQSMQQLSGGNIVLYYAAKVFAQTGQAGPQASLLANGISSAVLVVGTFSLTMLLDFYGRRKPIFIGHTCMGVCLVIVASVLVGYGAPHFEQTTQSVEFSFANASAGRAALAFIFLFQFFFGALNSSIPWTYQSEVFPIAARARGTSLSTSMNYMTNFWLGLYIPEALNAASWKVYFIFGGINFLCAVLGYLFYPETARRTLEELDLLFTPDRKVFVFLDSDATSRRPILEHELVGDDALAAAEELRKRLAQSGKERVESDYKHVSHA